MAMKITQEYMDDYVIDPFNKRFKDIEDKIDLLKNDIEFLVKEFDKVTKIIKKVK